MVDAVANTSIAGAKLYWSTKPFAPALSGPEGSYVLRPDQEGRIWLPIFMYMGDPIIGPGDIVVEVPGYEKTIVRVDVTIGYTLERRGVEVRLEKAKPASGSDEAPRGRE